MHAATSLVLWKPGTTETGGLRVPLANQAARSRPVGAQQWLSFAAPEGGVYYLEVKLVRPVRNPVVYTLAVATRHLAT